MARPAKKGLIFYRNNTDRYQDVKIKRLIYTYKCEGITIWDFILNEIYRLEGCYITFDDNFAFNVADTLKINEETVKNIVNFCVGIELFSAKIYADHQILTSKAIQNFYIDACIISKRKFMIIPEFIKLIQEETKLIQEETDENTEIIQQSNVTKHNITKLSTHTSGDGCFLQSEIGAVANLPFFYFEKNVVKKSVSDFYKKECQIIMEAELTSRGIDEAEALSKFDKKYNYSAFENIHHMTSAFKIILTKIEEARIKPNATYKKLTVRGNAYQNQNEQWK